MALLVEFGDRAADPTIVPNQCAELFEINQVDENEKALYWIILWGLFLIFRLGGLAILRKKATKFY